MIKLFKAENWMQDRWWCFAPDEKTAKKIIKKEIFAGKIRKFKLSDVTSEYLDQDGVKYLIDHDFVGIPEKSEFMLNCCSSAMNTHYSEKGRSSTLWWSDKIPGSRDLWKN
jgi:hypothetical protein